MSWIVAALTINQDLWSCRAADQIKGSNSEPAKMFRLRTFRLKWTMAENVCVYFKGTKVSHCEEGKSSQVQLDLATELLGSMFLLKSPPTPPARSVRPWFQTCREECASGWNDSTRISLVAVSWMVRNLQVEKVQRLDVNLCFWFLTDPVLVGQVWIWLSWIWCAGSVCPPPSSSFVTLQCFRPSSKFKY